MINLKTKDWEIKNIETILFDKDGTFIDLHYFWGKMTELRSSAVIKKYSLDENLHSELCLKLGYNKNSAKMLSDGITALYSRSKIIEIFCDDLKKIGVKTDEEELAKIFDEVSENFYENMFEYTKPIQSAIDFIKKVKKMGAKTGVVTSDSIKSTNLTIEHFRWEKLFDVLVGRECSNETKESGALTKIALDKIKANPKTTVMIGDAPMDFLSAKNAGVEKTILVSTGQIKTEELSLTSEFVVNSLDEILIL